MEKEKYHNIKLKASTYKELRKRKLMADANRPIAKPLTWDGFLMYITRKAV